MRSIRQSHKRQQRPIIFRCSVSSFVSNAQFDFRAPVQNPAIVSRSSFSQWGGGFAGYIDNKQRHQQTPGLLPGQHSPSMVKINHHHNGILAILLARHGDRSIVMQIVTGSTSKGEGQAGRIALCTIVFKNSNAVVPRESISSHMPKNRRRRKNS